MSNIIDCKDLKCPQPVINTKKYFDSITEGEATVIVDNEVAKNNIAKLAQSSSLKYKAEEKEGLFYIRLVKECAACKEMNFDAKKAAFTILVSSNKLGEGDDKLGAALMKTYVYALSESDVIPDDMLFINSGVKLTTEGSEVLDSLNKLKERGVNILNCGTCLDFYELKEKLQIGETTNMYTIIEKMNKADKTIKL